MEMTPKRFLACWLLTLTALVLAVGAFSVIVDPYRIFRTPQVSWFNAHKSAAANQEWLYKVYELNRVAPRTVLLGSSRVAVGMDARSSSWPPDRWPVYNLGLGSAMPYASFRYLQHLMTNHIPESVIVGLDFEYFLDVLESQHAAAGDFESRLAVNSDGSPNRNVGRQQLLDFAQIALSSDSLSDSFATVIGNIEGDTSDTADGNESDQELFRERVKTGTFPRMEWIDVVNARRFSGDRNQFAMADLRALLDLCEAHGTRVTLYIHPMPADTMEMMDLLGYWPMFEDWKRELVRVASQYPHRETAEGIVLWDFSDYDTYSTETVRPDGRVMHWFWESWHYTRALGDLVVGRMFDGSTAHFGAVLTTVNIESHLMQIRQRRQQYRMSHRADIDRVKAVYNAATLVLRSPAMAARNPATSER